MRKLMNINSDRNISINNNIKKYGTTDSNRKSIQPFLVSFQMTIIAHHFQHLAYCQSRYPYNKPPSTQTAQSIISSIDNEIGGSMVCL